MSWSALNVHPSLEDKQLSEDRANGLQITCLYREEKTLPLSNNIYSDIVLKGTYIIGVRRLHCSFSLIRILLFEHNYGLEQNYSLYRVLRLLQYSRRTTMKTF